MCIVLLSAGSLLYAGDIVTVRNATGRWEVSGDITMAEAEERAMNEAIHICYGGNRRVFPGLLLSALSVIKHTDRPVRLYVLSMDLHEQDACYLPFSEAQMEALNAVLREKNPESGARLIDVGEAYRRSLAGGKNKKNYYTPYATLR